MTIHALFKRVSSRTPLRLIICSCMVLLHATGKDLEQQLAVSSDAMQALQAAHTEVSAEIETVAAKLNDAEAQLADSSSKLKENDAALEELAQARGAAEQALQTAKEEHQLASKKQQQHAAELKKMIKSAQAADSGEVAVASGPASTASSVLDFSSPPEGRLRFPDSVEVNQHAMWCGRNGLGWTPACGRRSCLWLLLLLHSLWRTVGTSSGYCAWLFF